MCDKHPAFHTALVAACGNPVLELVTTPLFRVGNIREVLSGFSTEFWVQIDADHRAIFGGGDGGRRRGGRVRPRRAIWTTSGTPCWCARRDGARRAGRRRWATAAGDADLVSDGVA
jgi:hypothetical protein